MLIEENANNKSFNSRNLSGKISEATEAINEMLLMSMEQSILMPAVLDQLYSVGIWIANT